MEKAEFDRVADEYTLLHTQNLKSSGESPEFFSRYKIEDLYKEVAASELSANKILDFGSGIGNSLPHLSSFFPCSHITCADVSARSLEISKLRHAGISASYAEIVDMMLPFDDGSFDVCFSACVFHHITHAEHLHWLTELNRVTRSGGMIVIFEHNPANPLTVSAVRNCPFDENAELIWAGKLRNFTSAAGWCEAETVYRMFFPHSLAFARPLERYFRKLPLGAQYFVKARKL